MYWNLLGFVVYLEYLFKNFQYSNELVARVFPFRCDRFCCSRFKLILTYSSSMKFIRRLIIIMYDFLKPCLAYCIFITEFQRSANHRRIYFSCVNLFDTIVITMLLSLLLTIRCRKVISCYVLWLINSFYKIALYAFWIRFWLVLYYHLLLANYHNTNSISLCFCCRMQSNCNNFLVNSQLDIQYCIDRSKARWSIVLCFIN